MKDNSIKALKKQSNLVWVFSGQKHTRQVLFHDKALNCEQLFSEFLSTVTRFSHNIYRQFSKTCMMFVTFMMAIGCVSFLKMCIFVLDEL